ncbi:asparagine synthase (glutamine-hydrolyzing), partial [bacterium]|nr:asparagine synthase (glutamine-hydrolyzing) [bacterium]
MCGITGFIQFEKQTARDELIHNVRAMVDSISHRGPDDFGEWVDEQANIALGHRRLSIIDLSPEGHQPMVSASGRYVIVYNGEVYNFQPLRQRLESRGHVFRGHSDTEVILAAIETWGVEESVKEFIGMFAFAVWDRENRQLFLVRDRVGIKPLYYGWNNGAFLFGSELKPFWRHPSWQGEIDRHALGLFFRHNYIPSPYTIFQGIYKLPPATILTVNLERDRTPDRHNPFPDDASSPLHPVCYWPIDKLYMQGLEHPFEGTDQEAIEELNALLNDAVSGRMIADTPLGAFLSGGIDSSAVVACMQEQSSRPVKTFTIGFREEGFNEAEHAKSIAAYLGTDHTELYLEPKEALDVVSLLPRLYDEPFADSSQIPTYLLSKMTREHVTVALSGDGGDELFAGYNRYYTVQSIWDKAGYLPHDLRKPLVRGMNSLLNGMGFFFHKNNRLLPQALRQRSMRNITSKIDDIAAAASMEAAYEQFISLCHFPDRLVEGYQEPFLPSAYKPIEKTESLSHSIRKFMFRDMVHYLPDDILTKVDRASMGVSLEARVPVLDHRILEFSFKLPFSMLYRNNQRKWILKQLLYKRVPQPFFARPKTGFGVPLRFWLQGPLHEWANSMISET